VQIPIWSSQERISSAWIVPSIWTSWSPPEILGQSCFLRWNWSLECAHPFIDETDGHNRTHCTKLQIRELHKMSVKKLTSSFPEFPLWATKLQGQPNTTLWKRVVNEQVLVGLFEVIGEFIMLYDILKRLKITFTPNGKREFVPRDQVSVRSDPTRSLQPVFTIFTFLTKQPWCNAVLLHSLF